MRICSHSACQLVKATWREKNKVSSFRCRICTACAPKAGSLLKYTPTLSRQVGNKFILFYSNCYKEINHNKNNYHKNKSDTRTEVGNQKNPKPSELRNYVNLSKLIFPFKIIFKNVNALLYSNNENYYFIKLPCLWFYLIYRLKFNC